MFVPCQLVPKGVTTQCFLDELHPPEFIVQRLYVSEKTKTTKDKTKAKKSGCVSFKGPVTPERSEKTFRSGVVSEL